MKIAEQKQKQRVIQAEAEAQAIKIQALAQADAYQQIAAQIGSSNAALIEVLKIVGERGIEITPRVMVSGGGAKRRQPDDRADRHDARHDGRPHAGCATPPRTTAAKPHS